MKISDLDFKHDPDICPAFGAYLRYVLDANQGDTVETVADHLGVTERTVYRILSGKRTKKKNSDKFDDLIAYLFERIEDPSEMTGFDVWLYEYKGIKSAKEDGSLETDPDFQDEESDISRYLIPALENKFNPPAIVEVIRYDRIRSNIPYWAAIFAVIAVTGASMYKLYSVQEEIAADSDSIGQDEYARLEAEMEARKAEARRRATPEASELTLQPKFGTSWYDGSLRVWLDQLDGAPPGAEIKLSNDGVLFERTENDQDFLPGDKFIIRLASDDWAMEVGDFDFTELARAAAVRELEEIANQTQFFKCAAGYCELPTHRVCDKSWTKLTLGRRPGNIELEYELVGCRDIHQKCFISPEEIFFVKPEQKLYSSLYSVDGGKFDFEFQARELQDSLSDNPEVVPLLVDGDPQSAPYAIAWFLLHGGRPGSVFGIQIYAGGCRGPSLALEEAFSKIYYDIDGSGWVSGDLRYLSFPLPDRDYIEILLVGNNGKEYGPYRYQLDAERLVRQSINSVSKPREIECRNRKIDGTYYKVCYVQETVKNSVLWAHVKGIAFGETAEDLNSYFQIRADERSILTVRQEYDKWNVKDLFTYVVKKSQTRVYYQIYYKDGSESVVELLDMK